MDSCQVVGPRGLCRPLGDFLGNSRVAHSDRPQTAPAPWNLPASSPRPPQTDPKKHDDRRYCVRRSRVISVPAYQEALPSLTVLSRLSAGASVGGSDFRVYGFRMRVRAFGLQLLGARFRLADSSRVLGAGGCNPEPYISKTRRRYHSTQQSRNENLNPEP